MSASDSCTERCNSLSTLSQKSATAAEFGDSRRFLRQSHFCETVWTGLKSHNQQCFRCYSFFLGLTVEKRLDAIQEERRRPV